MNNFIVDSNKCKGCGLCVQECGFSKNITLQGNKAHYNEDSTNCIECFHCLKVCPQGAISYNKNGRPDITVFNHDDTISPVLLRRSCRDYKKKGIDRDFLTKIINKSNMAPRFDIEFSERKFIVIDDETTMNEVRTVVLQQITKVKNIFNILRKILFLPKKKRDEYNTIVDLFLKILEKNKIKDSLFHGAPALVLVTGEKSKTTTKDNSLYAMSQFLIAAEEVHLGTCINGFVSFFAKAVEKTLGIYGEYTIHAAAVVGHPNTAFKRHVVRSDTSIEWL